MLVAIKLHHTIKKRFPLKMKMLSLYFKRNSLTIIIARVVNNHDSI